MKFNLMFRMSWYLLSFREKNREGAKKIFSSLLRGNHYVNF